MRWTRTVDLSPGGAGHRRDVDRARWNAARRRRHAGKPLDVMALKGTSLDEVRDYEAFLRATAATLYGRGCSPRPTCPCCHAPSATAPEALRVFDVAYVRCPTCGHGYVRDQPPPTALDALFEGSGEHSSTYTDPATL